MYRGHRRGLRGESVLDDGGRRGLRDHSDLTGGQRPGGLRGKNLTRDVELGL